MSGLTVQLLLTLLTMIVIGVVTVVKVGAWWPRLALIDLLAVILIKRLDTIGLYVGRDVINQSMSDLATFLALGAITVAMLGAYQRRSYLSRAERERQSDLHNRHGATIAELEALRMSDETKYHHDWDTLVTPVLRSR